MSERQSEAVSIFHAVTEAALERREAILSERCAGDAELRAVVERLLAHDDNGMPGFLSPPLREMESVFASNVSVPPDTWVGPYQILEVLAEGGMGTVYAARQSKPVERDVALKVIRAGMDSKRVIARFEAERQALALMDHPNIAKVLDAGETREGQPYFVMELIRGLPINEYCDRHRMTTRERLELFRLVCEAVQHAHQKAVIHRDLKPSNVLVTDVGGRPSPTIIDFGVAKATARRLTERTLATEQGVMIGTLEYMSPEQANLTGDDVDTRTDVYSLGVILHELLVGLLPLDSGNVPAGGFEEMRRRLLEEEPKRPSTRIPSSDARSTERARERGTDPRTLRRQLRGDIDWIVLRALDKDRERRYDSPRDLATDIQRYLTHEPVEARRPSARYRASKFVRRHRLGMTAATLVALALLTAVVGTSIGLVRARRAEAVARAEQVRSQKAATFLADTLRGIDPASMGRTLASMLDERAHRPDHAAHESERTVVPHAFGASYGGVNLIDPVRSALDGEIFGKAVKRIDVELGQDPELAADLYHAIGNAYVNLAVLPSAVVCFERAVRLSEGARGRDDLTTNKFKVALGDAYQSVGRYRDAEKVFLEAIGSLERTRGAEAAETLEAMGLLGWSYQQEGQATRVGGDADLGSRPSERADQAVALLRSTYQTMRRVLGDDDPLTLHAGHGLGLALRDQLHFEEAETLLRELIERSSRVLGRDNPETINTRVSLGSVFWGMGRWDEVERMGLELLEDSRRIDGDGGFLALLIQLKLGQLYTNQGRYNEARGLLRDSAEKLTQVLGEESPFTHEAAAATARLNSLQSAHPANDSGK